MTVIRPVSLGSGFKPAAAQLFAWDNLKSLETGPSLDSSLYSRISIQIGGQFGGSTVNIEGSNDGNNWYVLIDAQDNHMRLSFPGISDIGQYSRYIRPTVLNGDVTTAITIFAMCRGV